MPSGSVLVKTANAEQTIFRGLTLFVPMDRTEKCQLSLGWRWDTWCEIFQSVGPGGRRG